VQSERRCSCVMFPLRICARQRRFVRSFLRASLVSAASCKPIPASEAGVRCAEFWIKSGYEDLNGFEVFPDCGAMPLKRPVLLFSLSTFTARSLADILWRACALLGRTLVFLGLPDAFSVLLSVEDRCGFPRSRSKVLRNPLICEL
jgi:hypothetical protein